MSRVLRMRGGALNMAIGSTRVSESPAHVWPQPPRAGLVSEQFVCGDCVAYNLCFVGGASVE